MANNEQANSFLEMMQGNNDKDIDFNTIESGLPADPKLDNGQELNLVTSNWETRPLAGESTDYDTSEVKVIKPIQPKEKSKQRNFGLTDSQHHQLLQAAADFGFVRVGKDGKIEPNASAFLQKIIDLKLWEKYNEIEEGASHE
ncbi:hypothetical protein [Lactococcus lactis]|uniref:hypothetical protein n=1 Tax=Lactococcus lactis TaxID=1358 RepID=UPI0019118B16|nr:hypothetical protein [Lactococcus lactis]WDA70005.1 hypothetical protein IL310_08160 [Lactococcus lactis]